jgi:hypothetical protein
MATVTLEDLDHILALQLTVAWAGEALSEPARLRWWKTDLVDEAGGGDLLSRLLPRTHRWAALESVREAARRVDARARAKLADPDAAVTLYHWGFDRDEQLAERLTHHKRHANAAEAATDPAAVLGQALGITAAFEVAAFEAFLRKLCAKAAYETVPHGRQLKGPRPGSDAELCDRLVAALLPLSGEYPMPFAKKAS